MTMGIRGQQWYSDLHHNESSPLITWIVIIHPGNDSFQREDTRAYKRRNILCEIRFDT